MSLSALGTYSSTKMKSIVTTILNKNEIIRCQMNWFVQGAAGLVRRSLFYSAWSSLYVIVQSDGQPGFVQPQPTVQRLY